MTQCALFIAQSSKHNLNCAENNAMARIVKYIPHGTACYSQWRTQKISEGRQSFGTIV